MKKTNYTPTRFDIDNTYYDAKLLKNVSTGNIHWHSHFLISIFTRNNGTQFLNNIEYKFEPGTAIIMGPFDFHYNKINGDETFDAYSIKFTHKVFNEHLCKICTLDHFPIVSKLSDKDYSLAESICDFLIEEKNTPDCYEKEILINNFIEQLVILIMRNAKKKNDESGSDTTIRRALVYIHDNFKQDITVKDVAGLLFSAWSASLTRREALRFIREYSCCPLKIELSKNRKFWQDVDRTARKLFYKEHGAEPTWMTSESLRASGIAEAKVKNA